MQAFLGHFYALNKAKKTGKNSATSTLFSPIFSLLQNQFLMQRTGQPSLLV
jgi:hypothetical protein